MRNLLCGRKPWYSNRRIFLGVNLNRPNRQLLNVTILSLFIMGGCTRTYTISKASYQESTAQGGDYVSVKLPRKQTTYVYRDAILETWEIPGQDDVLAAELDDLPATLEASGIGLTLSGGAMVLTGLIVMGLGSNVKGNESAPSSLGITFLSLGLTFGLAGGAGLLMAPYVEGPHPPGYDPQGPVKGLKILAPQ